MYALVFMYCTHTVQPFEYQLAEDVKCKSCRVDDMRATKENEAKYGYQPRTQNLGFRAENFGFGFRV